MAARLTAYVVVAIVAATLIAGLIVGAQRDDSSGPVDLIVHNANVYDAGTPPKFAEAIAIRGNKILRVGSEREIMRYRRPQTIVIDARGATVLPGFDDAHASFIAGGLALSGVILTGALSMDDVQQRLSAWAGEHPESLWITGSGWTDDMVGQPARAALDGVVADRPVALRSQDGRAMWVNTRALAAAHITRRTRDPRDGTIVRDRRGEPTGLLKGSAMTLVQRLIPAPAPDARAQALLAAIEDAHRHGITSVQDTAGAGDLDVYDAARKSGALDLRVYVGAPATMTSVKDLAGYAQRYPDDPLLKAGLATIAIDAPTDSTASEVARLVTEIEAQGLQPAVDAPTMRDVHVALDAYQSAKARAGARAARARLDDLNDVAPEDLPRLQALGVIASTPLARDSSPFAPLKNLGAPAIRIVFGSDWPKLPLDPLASIGAAVESAAAPDDPASADRGAQRLALESAINAWTSNSAWASFDDQRKGTIRPGMLADLVVLSGDIFKDPSQIASAKVAMTIFDGKVVYRGN